ncbi:hypothetical protein C9994_08645 [Marivirga lumbricoides]|uniref:Uncharacterized protein n=1 Tax=Marivirga lumbricoides TaxID=1046115 RepID=A0A2T4DQT4_9BACT|nr:hypothetical protein C9994_08645 [Marivirga lumbricoides]
MDKSRRKGIKKQYKAESRQDYLLNLVVNEHSSIRGFAQIELGIDLPPITKETIEADTTGFDLIEKLYLKIIEKAHKNNPKSKRFFGPEIENTIKEFSPYLQAVYYSHLFESVISIGDIDKEFIYDGEIVKNQLDVKLDNLIAAYQLMENERMLTFIEKARIVDDYDALQKIAKMYQSEEMDKHQLEFIKKNWKEFEMK